MSSSKFFCRYDSFSHCRPLFPFRLIHILSSEKILQRFFQYIFYSLTLYRSFLYRAKAFRTPVTKRNKSLYRLRLHFICRCFSPYLSVLFLPDEQHDQAFFQYLLLSRSSTISFSAVFFPIPGADEIIFASPDMIANRSSSGDIHDKIFKPPFGPIPLTPITSRNIPNHLLSKIKKLHGIFPHIQISVKFHFISYRR